MTDEPDALRRRPRDAEVRRLLADARHTEPMPADVAPGWTTSSPTSRGRDDPRAATAPAAPDAGRRPARRPPPAPGRRDCWSPRPRSSSAASSSPSTSRPAPATSSRSRRRGRRAAGATAARRSSGQRARPRAPAPDARTPAEHDRRRPVVVRPRALHRRRARGRRACSKARDRAGGRGADELAPRAPGRAAAPAAAARARRTSGPRPSLVYRPAEGSAQVVDLFVCGDRQPVRSATLPGTLSARRPARAGPDAGIPLAYDLL